MDVRLADMTRSLLPESPVLGKYVQFLDKQFPSWEHGPLTRYAKLRVVHASGMPGTFPRHRGFAIPTCITARSLTSGFLWSRWRGKRSRHTTCATRNVTDLVRGPWHENVVRKRFNGDGWFPPQRDKNAEFSVMSLSTRPDVYAVNRTSNKHVLLPVISTHSCMWPSCK